MHTKRPEANITNGGALKQTRSPSLTPKLFSIIFALFERNNQSIYELGFRKNAIVAHRTVAGSDIGKCLTYPYVYKHIHEG